MSERIEHYKSFSSFPTHTTVKTAVQIGGVIGLQEVAQIQSLFRIHVIHTTQSTFYFIFIFAFSLFYLLKFQDSGK